MSFLSRVLAILWKDVRAEFRTKEMMSSMLIFALLVVVIFSFALDPADPQVRRAFPGILWVAFFFAGVLGLNRSFTSEKQGDCLQGLMLSPVDRSAIYFGKVAGNLVFMTAMEAITLPVFLIFYDYPVGGVGWRLVLVIVASTLGFVAVGTFLAALAANTRTSEILLPIILFPIVVPIVLAAVQSTGALLEGRVSVDVSVWLKVLAAYDTLFLVVPFLLFEYLLEV